MGDTSHYFHASLYAFNPEARIAVVTKVNQAVNNAALKCWYDPGTEVSHIHHWSYQTKKPIISQSFCLECPGHLGAYVDLTLGDVIRDYIDSELKAAESEGVSFASLLIQFYWSNLLTSSRHSEILM